MTFLILQILFCLLIAFALGVLLGWWLGRRFGVAASREAEERWRQELDKSRTALAECETELTGLAEGASRDTSAALTEAEERWRHELEETRTELTESRAALAECKKARVSPADEGPRAGVEEPQIAGVLPLVGTIGEGGLEDKETEQAQDDLKVVEGIGPKIEGLLNAEGIRTWKQLSETAVARIQAILDAAGPRYRIHNPASWPDQAKLAAQGRWDELQRLQDVLIAGRYDS